MSMTIDNSADVVLTSHTWTPQGIAYASCAQARADLLKACEQIRTQTDNNESIAIIEEAIEQMQAAVTMLSGRDANGQPWML